MASAAGRRGRPPGRTALQVFDDLLADAEHLLHLAEMLENGRVNRMRAELRESVGAALSVPRARREHLDCVESDDLFVVLKPGGGALRRHFSEAELRPLLRQAVVATAAAVESYVAVRARDFIGQALRDEPTRLRGIRVSFGEILDLDRNYTRRGWGRRAVIEQYLDREASSNPEKIAAVFGVLGKGNLWPAVDKHRKVDSGESMASLRRLADRRNAIAHTGDRKGSGRAPLTPSEVKRFVVEARAIVMALDTILSP